MHVLSTERLAIRWFTHDDAPFVLQLLNDLAFLRFVGDRGVRTVDDARSYISDRMIDSYDQLGFGLYHVALLESGTPIGMCGFVKREWLEDVDVGFSFLPEFWGKGYAFEAASAVVAYARETLAIERIVAVTAPDNERSMRLLEKLGLRFDRGIRGPEGEPCQLFVAEAGL